MQSRRRGLLYIIMACCSLLCFCSTALRAQELPSSPIRIVVPYPAGGGTDAFARTLASNLSTSLARPVIVENRSGGATIVGTDVVAKAAPDGGTMLLVTDTFAINDAVPQRLPYDTRKDFQPLVRLINVPFVLSAHPRTKLVNLKQFVDFARSNPGKLTFGSLGPASPHELIMLYFAKQQGIEVLNIPYRGTAPALQALVAGEVDLTFTGIAASEQFRTEGKLRWLAAPSVERAAAGAGLTTARDQGFPDIALDTWFGIVLPARVPPSIVATYLTEFSKLIKLPAVQKLIHAIGGEAALLPSSDFESFLRKEAERYREVLARTGAKLE